MDLRTFLSVLLVYHCNFKVLHWMVKGDEFLTIHTKADEYCNDVAEDIDKVGEMILRTNGEIVNYKEALDIVEDIESHEFLLIESGNSYDTEEFCNYSMKMFKDILVCIQELLDGEISNVGIKSTLEGMYDKYDLQANYILKRLGK